MFQRLLALRGLHFLPGPEFVASQHIESSPRRHEQVINDTSRCR